MAIVQINESNGAGETETTNITNSNWGSTDTVNLTAAAAPIAPGANSFEKWQRIHVTDMETASAIKTLKVWRTGALGGAATHLTNARETTYGGAATYATPTASASSVATQTMPTTEPTGANLGIGGSLTGEITVAGRSDYLVHQLQTNAADTAGATTTISYQYTVVE